MRNVLAATAALGAKNSHISKVIDMLGEMKGKITADLEGEKKSMLEYTAFCDDESVERKHAIEAATREIEIYMATAQEAQGAIESSAATIEEAGAEIAAKEGELAAAKDDRASTKEVFGAAEKELVETVDTLGRAVVVLKRELSFIQGGKTPAAFRGLADALGAIVDANSNWLSTEDKKEVQAFIQSTQEPEEDDLALPPQATEVAYESKSGGIVQILEEMKEKAGTELQELRTKEMEDKHAFQMTEQALTMGVAAREKEMAESKESSEVAKGKLAKSEAGKAEEEAAKKADEDYLETLTHDCAAKQSEWETREKSATEEITALAKGMEVLQGGVKVFVQTRASTRLSKMRALIQSKKEVVRSKVSALLKKLAVSSGSFALMEMASAVKKDPFEKIRGLINGMINKLEQQSVEEANHDAFCKEETKKSQTKRDLKQGEADKYQARIDEANATLVELEEEIKELHAEVQAITGATAEATKLRTAENAEFVKTSTDYKESVDAVAQAIKTLKEFYSGESFLQQPATPEFAESKGDAASMIIGILETAETDFAKELAEMEASETESKDTHEKLMQENRVSKSTKEAETKGKESEVKSLKTALTHHGEDYKSVSAELDAVLEYIEKLKPQCTSKAMTYEERKAKRESELDGLKTALEILAVDNSSPAEV